MIDHDSQTIVPEVPKQVCDKFLEELQNTGIPVELVDRLRKVLLEERNFTEKAIRVALFPSDQEQ